MGNMYMHGAPMQTLVLSGVLRPALTAWTELEIFIQYFQDHNLPIVNSQAISIQYNS